MNIASRILSNQDRDGMLRRSLERIIQLYTDKSHFVYELLQNAEDSCATRIRFEQFEDVLVVMHNGKAFTETNLQGLCDIGQSDKINNLNQIGEFGVGFKSVFGICKTVRLYSNPGKEEIAGGCERFAVEIQDFTKPVEIEYKEVPEGYTTVFEFPYCVGETFSGFKTVQELKKAISTRLKDLGITTLLFMRNLAIIDFEVHCVGLENKGQYRLTKKTLRPGCTHVYAVENEEKKRGNAVSFLRFSLAIDKEMPNRTLDIAFQMIEDDNGKITFEPARSPYISVYFPTETESKLKFIVQGPFRTTPNRSSVPADDEMNVRFANMLARLLHKSILAVRDLGMLNLSFLKVLPLDEKPFNTYGLFLPLLEETKVTLRNEEVLPTKDEKHYVKLNRAILAGNIGLTDIFTGHDMAELQKRKTDFEWLPTTITERGAYSDLYAYLVNVLGVDVIRATELRIYFNENVEFLEKKDNDWLVKLYKLYETIPSAFTFSGRSMLDAWIIRTESERIRPAYQKIENKYSPVVFLPSNHGKNKGVEFVHPYLYDRCRSFFETVLHLKKPDDYELTKETIASHYKVISAIDDNDHLKDIGKALRYLRNPDQEGDMRSFLRKNTYIRVKARQKTLWARPFEETLYFPETEDGMRIEQYFEGLPGENANVYLDYEFYRAAGYTIEDMKLFDVTDSILTGLDETSGDYKNVKTGEITTWRTYGTFRWKLSIEQLEDALLYISKNPKSPASMVKSQIIFRTLQQNEIRLRGKVCIPNGKDLFDEPSEIIHILKRERRQRLGDWDGKWLYTKTMDLESQSDILRKNLNESLYGKVKTDSELYELLGFKKNRQDQLAEATVEYDKIPKETRQMYLEIELSRSFGLTIEQLKSMKENAFIHGNSTRRQEDSGDYEFPTENVKNWEALKKHAAQILLYANPVSYAKVVRSVRVSRADEDVAAYLKNMYRVNASHKYACQICHRPHSTVEMCQLENKPNKELDPLNLCLCANCAAKFRIIRNNETLCSELMQKIATLTEVDIRQNDHVSVTITDLDLWFTQTHMAEIVELLKLKDQADKVIDEAKEMEVQRASVYAPKLKLPNRNPESQASVSSREANLSVPPRPDNAQRINQPLSRIKREEEERSPWETSTRPYTAQTWKPTIKPVQSVPERGVSAEQVKREQALLQAQKEAKEKRDKEEKIRRQYMDYVGRTVYHVGFKAHIFVERCTAKELDVHIVDGPRKGQKASIQIAFCAERNLIWPEKDVLSIIKQKEIPYVDRREYGGALWVIGSHELDSLMSELENHGFRFVYKDDGGKATKGASAWYLAQ